MPDIDNVPAEIAVQLRNERDTMQRAHVEESKRAETAERQAAFWKDRYDTQHRTVHGLEDTVEQLREALRFYGDEANYDDNGTPGTTIHIPSLPTNGGEEWEWEEDRGAKARAALEKAQGPP